MEKQKILFILHLPPPIHGAAMMGQFIADSKIINLRYRTKFVNLGVTKHFKDRKRFTFGKLAHFFTLFKHCLKAYRYFKPDLVYISLTSNGMGFFKDAVIVFMLKALGAKLVYHFHNKGIRKNQNKLIYDFFYRQVFKNADVILLSKWLYPDIKNYVREDKIQYCHNGIPLPPYKIKERIVKPDNKLTEILFLSNLIESKGVYTVLDACKHLDDKDLDFRCTFVGSEGDIKIDELKSKINMLNLSNKVFYAGKKYDREKHEAFENAHVFIFPTHYPNECFPLVTLEAMQYSLPVISTPEGGIRDIIDDNETGFIVPQKDANSLAKKLEILIKDPALQLKMGKAGHKKYQREFTVEIYGNRLDTIFKNVLSN